MLGLARQSGCTEHGYASEGNSASLASDGAGECANDGFEGREKAIPEPIHRPMPPTVEIHGPMCGIGMLVSRCLHKKPGTVRGKVVHYLMCAECSFKHE